MMPRWIRGSRPTPACSSSASRRSRAGRCSSARSRSPGRWSRRSAASSRRRGARSLVRLALRRRAPTPSCARRRLELLEHAADDRTVTRSRTRTRTWRSSRPRTRARAPTSPPSGSGRASKRCAMPHRAVPQRREALGRLLLPDGCRRPGRGRPSARLRGLPVRRRAGRLGSAACRRWRRIAEQLRPRRDGADRRRGNRPHLQPGGADRKGGRARREHAGRRGLLLAGRGLGRRRRSPTPSTRPATSATRSRGRAPPLRGRPGRRGVGHERRGVPARHARHRRGRPAPGRVRNRLQPGDPRGT